MSRDIRILNVQFPLTGIMMTYLGTLLPQLAARWSLSDAQAGELFSAQFAGAMAGSLTQGLIASRWGANKCVPIGFVLMALGTAGVAWGSGLAAGMAGIFCSGIGFGWAVPASNWLAARYSPAEDQTRAINILNAAWCAGAMAGPALIARGLGWFGLERTLAGMIVLLAAAAVLTWFLTDADGPAAKQSSSADSRRRVRSLALVASAMLFLYVGIENGFSGWTPSLAARELSLSTADASLALSAFWASVLISRLLVSFTGLARSIGLRSLVPALALAAAGLFLMTIPENRYALGLGVVLAGAGCSTIFPTIVSLFQSRAGDGSESWMGFVIAAGSLGASIIPWMVGASSSGLGGLRWSMFAILIVSIAGVAAFLPAMRDTPSPR